MTRLVLLQCPLDDFREVHVLVGAANIETAAGFRPDQTARLFSDDKAAIWKAMRA